MTRYRRPTVWLTLIGLVAGGLWFIGQSSNSPAEDARAPLELGTASPPGNVDPRLEQIQLQIARLRRQLEIQQQTVARMQHAGVPGHSAGDRTEADRALANQRAREARLSRLESELTEQVEDVGWSRAAEGQIADAIGRGMEALAKDGLGQAPQLTDVTCRSSLCRLTLERGDEMSTQRFVEQFPEWLGWRETHGLVQTIVNGSGEVGTLIYLSREGHSLY